jgi:hypothetical protein
MRKTKFNPELLKEEAKKFKLLSEYDFYQEEKEAPEYEKPLLLGNDLEEAEDENNAEAPVDDAAVDNIAAELGVEEPAQDGEETPAEEPVEEPVAEPEAPVAEPASDEIEVDVTSLVQGSEEAKESADRASQNSEMLLQKLSDLEAKLNQMDSVGAKIDELEKEIVKRNPTPVEKLEMRSLNSFPYTQKLTDYWADKEGQYDVMGKDKEEYTLTKNDVDYGYSEPEIRKSFSVSPDEFEEEEI